MVGWSASGSSRRLTLSRSEISSAAMWSAVVRVTVGGGVVNYFRHGDLKPWDEAYSTRIYHPE